MHKKRKMATYTLVSNDDQEFEVGETMAQMSGTIKNLIEEDMVSDGVIPLPNVSGRMLAKVLEFTKHHLEYPSDETELSDWDKDFFNVDQSDLFELILASNYLEMQLLLDLACKSVANMVIGKSPDEIRALFNIKNDFTEEEEAVAKEENKWLQDQ